MERYTLNNTDLQVSKLCFGTMTFGGQTPEKASIELIDAALADGLNFFDTADMYNEGSAEEILGKALSGKRADVVLASKVYYPLHQDDSRGLSASRMREKLEGSLKRLNTDYLDIYYLHQPDRETSLNETLEALDTFKKAVSYTHLGLSYTSINQTRMATGEVYCQTLIELAKENPRIVASVSYTHLDVYKRQDQEVPA